MIAADTLLPSSILEVTNRDTGRFLALTADDERGAIDAEPHITGAVLMQGEHCLEIRNGRYTVDGVVTCLTLQSALGLMQS